MALEQLLAQMGAVPQGATPMNIDTTTGQTTPSWQDTSPMGVFLRQLEAQEKKKQEEQKRKADLYNTLRQAGYSAKEAYESVESGKFMMPSGERSLEEEEKYWKTEKTKKEVLEPKKTDIETKRENFLKARKGEITWNELSDLYPDNPDQVEKAKKQSLKEGKLTEPLGKTPIKQVGKGHIIARMKPQYANMDLQTKAEAEKIYSYSDLLNLIENSSVLEAKGVDIDSLFKYYNAEIEELERLGYIKGIE